MVASTKQSWIDGSPASVGHWTVAKWRKRMQQKVLWLLRNEYGGVISSYQMKREFWRSGTTWRHAQVALRQLETAGKVFRVEIYFVGQPDHRIKSFVLSPNPLSAAQYGSIIAFRQRHHLCRRVWVLNSSKWPRKEPKWIHKKIRDPRVPAIPH